LVIETMPRVVFGSKVSASGAAVAELVHTKPTIQSKAYPVAGSERCTRSLLNSKTDFPSDATGSNSPRHGVP
jgi:hypothetical protein